VLPTFVWNAGRILSHAKCQIRGNNVMESQVAVLFGLAVIVVPIALWRLWQLDGAPAIQLSPNGDRVMLTRSGPSILARLNNLTAPVADQDGVIAGLRGR
jgi:hypothetical protein